MEIHSSRRHQLRCGTLGKLGTTITGDSRSSDWRSTTATYSIPKGDPFPLALAQKAPNRQEIETLTRELAECLPRRNRQSMSMNQSHLASRASVVEEQPRGVGKLPGALAIELDDRHGEGRRAARASDVAGLQLKDGCLRLLPCCRCQRRGTHPLPHGSRAPHHRN